MTPMDDSPRIRALAEERNIVFLYHFTRCSNIRSILRYGLVPRLHFAEFGIDAEVTDEKRIDGYDESVCVSVAHPNYKMFFRRRGGARKYDHEWAVVQIDRSVLWNYPCAFCRHNASDSRVLRILEHNPQDLMTYEAFESLFSERLGGKSRSFRSLKSSEPTDPQAEILVFGVIAPEFITRVISANEGLRDYCDWIHPNVQWAPPSQSEWAYLPRHDYWAEKE
jgi:hypothetical protein